MYCAFLFLFYFIYKKDNIISEQPFFTSFLNSRLVSVGTLKREREPGEDKLDWLGNTGFDGNTSFQNPVRGFL